MPRMAHLEGNQLSFATLGIEEELESVCIFFCTCIQEQTVEVALTLWLLSPLISLPLPVSCTFNSCGRVLEEAVLCV